jgi:potassium-transporting ATPase KdpC subunit
MRRQLISGFAMIVVLTVLTGLVYPLMVTGVSQLAFGDKANGSFVKSSGNTVGSQLIGQNFSTDKYFQPRPSAAGSNGYDPTASAATNLGPSNPKLLSNVADAVAAYRAANNVPANVEVPGDAVTSSGSGLDPEISVANARLQAPRVASARSVPLNTVMGLINKHTEKRSLGFLGDEGVNVFELNLDLDHQA